MTARTKYPDLWVEILGMQRQLLLALKRDIPAMGVDEALEHHDAKLRKVLLQLNPPK